MEQNELLDALQAYGTNTAAAMERFVNDAELYDECLRLFLTDDCFKRLEQGLEQREYKAAFDAAHTLKGVAGNLGVTPMYDAICAVVEKLRAHSYDDLSPAYQQMLRELQRLKDVVHFQE